MGGPGENPLHQYQLQAITLCPERGPFSFALFVAALWTSADPLVDFRFEPDSFLVADNPRLRKSAVSHPLPQRRKSHGDARKDFFFLLGASAAAARRRRRGSLLLDAAWRILPGFGSAAMLGCEGKMPTTTRAPIASGLFVVGNLLTVLGPAKLQRRALHAPAYFIAKNAALVKCLVHFR